MSHQDQLLRVCAAMLGNPAIDPLRACAADVVAQARRVVEAVERAAAIAAATPAANAVSTAPRNGAAAPMKTRRVRDGRWLAGVADRRGALAWVEAFGAARGYPRKVADWSPGMVRAALDARRLVDA